MKSGFSTVELCCYITHPAIANERLKLNDAGDVVLQLKGPYQHGTTHVMVSLLEFMQNLAALVSRPRLNLIRFRGVFAPNAKLRPDTRLGDRCLGATSVSKLFPHRSVFGLQDQFLVCFCLSEKKLAIYRRAGLYIAQNAC